MPEHLHWSGSVPCVVVLGTDPTSELRRTVEAWVRDGADRVLVHLDPSPRWRDEASALREWVDALVASLEGVTIAVAVTPFRFGPRWATAAALDRAFRDEATVVVVEEGVVPVPGAIAAFGRSLADYADDQSVGQVCGVAGWASTGHRHLEPTLAVLGPLGAWGTWRDRWSCYEQNAYRALLASRSIVRDRGLPLRSRLILRRGVVQAAAGHDEFAWGWWSSLLAARARALIPPQDLVLLPDGPPRTPGLPRARALRSGTPRGGALGGPGDGAGAPEGGRPRRASREVLSSLGLVSPVGALKAVVILARRPREVGRLRGLMRRKSARMLRMAVLRPGPTLVVASSGRAGSSVLFGALLEEVLAERARPLLRSALRRPVVRVWVMARLGAFAVEPTHEELAAFPVIKTHALAGAFPTYPPVRAVFTWAQVEHTAASIRRRLEDAGSHWVDHHAYHLSALGRPYEFAMDPGPTIDLQRASWERVDWARSVPLDHLWDEQQRLASWLQLDRIPLPTRRGAAAGN